MEDTVMRLSSTLLVSLTFCILSSTAPVLAQNSTNIYEKDEETKALKTLTAKVRMASEDNGGWSVYFEGDKNSGVFFLSSKLSNFGSFTNLIEESRKPKGPHLKVTYDQDKNIESVVKTESPAVNLDINAVKKWDFEP